MIVRVRTQLRQLAGHVIACCAAADGSAAARAAAAAKASARAHTPRGGARAISTMIRFQEPRGLCVLWIAGRNWIIACLLLLVAGSRTRVIAAAHLLENRVPQGRFRMCNSKVTNWTVQACIWTARRWRDGGVGATSAPLRRAHRLGGW